MNQVKKDDFHIVAPTAALLASAVDFAAKIFANREPMAKALALTADEIRPAIAEIIDQSIHEKLALVAISPENQLCSFAFAINLEVPQTAPPNPSPEPSDKAKSIFCFLDQLTAQYTERSRSRTLKTANFLMLGTDFERLSPKENESLKHKFGQLTNRVVQAAFELQRKAGFKAVLAQATSRASRRYLRLHAFQEIAHCRYDSYTCPVLGAQPFLVLGKEKCELAVKDLSI